LSRLHWGFRIIEDGHGKHDMCKKKKKLFLLYFNIVVSFPLKKHSGAFGGRISFNISCNLFFRDIVYDFFICKLLSSLIFLSLLCFFLCLSLSLFFLLWGKLCVIMWLFWNCEPTTTCHVYHRLISSMKTCIVYMVYSN